MQLGSRPDCPDFPAAVLTHPQSGGHLSRCAGFLSLDAGLVYIAALDMTSAAQALRLFPLAAAVMAARAWTSGWTRTMSLPE